MKIKNPILSHRPIKHGGAFSMKNPDPLLLDFSSNINPIGPPPFVKKSITKNFHLVNVYPDPNSNKLRKNLSWYTKIPKDQIVVGNGATEIIYNFCRAFCFKKTVLIPVPTFGEYEVAAKLNGSKALFFKTMDLNSDTSEFVKKIPKNGCIFLCNPNNPTGKIIARKNMLKIILVAKKNSSIVFVDECFIELVPDSNESVSRDIKKFDNLFVLRSLTKSFGLAGLRIGYGLGNKEMIDTLNRIKIPWNVSVFAQEAARAALCNSLYLKKSKNIIKKESKFLKDSLSKINGFSCYDTSTNFLLVKTKLKSKIIQKKLLRKKILIRDCDNFRGLTGNYIRIAVKRRKENQKLIKALETLI